MSYALVAAKKKSASPDEVGYALLQRRYSSSYVAIGIHRSNPRNVEPEVPQASVLAVTLFLVRMNGLDADDVLPVVLGKTVKALREGLQVAATWITNGVANAWFELAPAKGVYMLIY